MELLLTVTTALPYALPMDKRDANYEDQKFLSTAAKRKSHVLGVIPSPEGGLECTAVEIAILDLLTVGTELSVVARRHGCSESDVRALAESARGVKYIAGLVVSRKEAEVCRRRKMEDLVGKALDTYEAILEKPEDQRVAAKVAGDILDRDPGRLFTRSTRVEQVGGRGVIDLDAVAERVVSELRERDEVESHTVEFEALSSDYVVCGGESDGDDLIV